MIDNQPLKQALDQIFISEDFQQATTLLLVPPFNFENMASVRVHVLQACAKAAGHKVVVVYTHILFAELIGRDCYDAIMVSGDVLLLSERLFSHAAFGLPPLGYNAERLFADGPLEVMVKGGGSFSLTFDMLIEVEKQANRFANQLVDYIASQHFSVVGCVNNMGQVAVSEALPNNSSSIAFLNQIKQKNASIITFMAGTNCEAQLGLGIASLSDHIDYVLRGEIETAFVDFLTSIQNRRPPPERLIDGVKCDDLDKLPLPDYSDFYSQLQAWQANINWDYIQLPFEASRGCWWGQKHHCTFCGINEMRYRAKSPELVVEQLQQLMAKHPSDLVHFNDEVLPLQYFKTLLPTLAALPDKIRHYSYLRPTLSLQQLKNLVASGAHAALAGIESLSTPLLQAMDKGNTGQQSISLLRYASSCEMYLIWFLMYGLPGEEAKYYQQMSDIIPLLEHLNPPLYMQPMRIVQFSPYAKYPEHYGINNLTPLAVYRDIYPHYADFDRLSCFYSGDYSTIESVDKALFDKLKRQVERWQQLWANEKSVLPQLFIASQGNGRYLLTDTRSCNEQMSFQLLDEAQAAAALVGHSLKKLPQGWQVDWAIENKVAVVMDDAIVPLALANVELLEYFESNYKRPINPNEQPIAVKAVG